MDYVTKEKKRLWETLKGEIHNGIHIGKLLCNWRNTSGRVVDDATMSTLNQLGYNDGKTTVLSRFELVYMPAFRACIFGKEKRLVETPALHVYKEINVGQILNNLKRKTRKVPSSCVDELVLLGFPVIN
jgi:hypothetical protein